MKTLSREQVLKQRLPLMFGLAVFLLTLAINRNVAVYGDDYGFHVFVTGGLDTFIKEHIRHYMQDNGRFIVHLLVTVFLALPKVFWRVTNSLLLGSFVYTGLKLIAKAGQVGTALENIVAGVVIGSGILALDISLARQSVYWLTGSFNYVFPIVLLFFCWYRLEDGSNNLLTALMFFLSAATVEQNAVMTVGLSLLYLVRGYHESAQKYRFANLGLSLAGAGTVLLSPSVAGRFRADAGTITIVDRLITNVKVQWVDFFAAPHNVFFQIVFIVSSCLFLISWKPVLNSKKRLVASVLGIFGFVEVFLILLLSRQQGYVMTINRFAILLIISAYYLVLTAFNVFILFRHKLAKDRHLPLFAFSLGVGSQLMMVVSPTWGPRNGLCGILMLCFCSSFYIVHTNRQQNLQTVKTALIALGAIVAFVSLSNTAKTAAGYAANMPVERKNVALIQEYREHLHESDSFAKLEQLHQFKLIDGRYGWSMPYESTYHEHYYKIWHGLPRDTEIKWLDFNN